MTSQCERKPVEQLRRERAASPIMHQIAHDDELARAVFVDQFRETRFDRSHPPERHQPARRALAQLVAEM